MRHPMLLSLAFLLLHTACTPAAAARPAPDDAFLRMNRAFRDIYQEAKVEALRRIGPVIVTGGEKDIALVWQGETKTASYVDGMTNKLKTVAHGPLTLAVAVQGEDTGDVIVLSDAKRAALENYADAFHKVRDAMHDAPFTDAQLERQTRIANAMEQALAALLSSKGMRRSEFEAFTTAMAPLVMANVDDAAMRMLDQLNYVVIRWRAELGDDWKNTRVVLMAPHMPARGLLQGQYFDRVMKSTGDEARVIYMEGGGSVEAGLDLLATHLTDTQSSETFFKEPRRLHRDILADAATRYLDTMPLPTFP